MKFTKLFVTLMVVALAMAGLAGLAHAASFEGTFEYHNASTEPGFSGVVNGTYSGSGSLSGGVYGKATGTHGNALMGWASGTYGRGVYGEASGSEGTAVFGTTSGTEGWGIHGTASGTTGRGVYGYASGTDSYGVYGYNFRNVGIRGFTFYGRDGVQGEARIATGRGVVGIGSGSQGIGMFGHASNTGYTAVTTGVYGVTSGGRGAGVRGISLSGASVNFGGYFQSYSTIGYGVLGYASGASGTNYGVLGRTASPAGYGVYSDGNMRVVGNFTATGTKSAVVKVGEKEHVLLYAEESTENWFTDYGKGELNSGKTIVHIDPTYAKTVNTENEYHVFLTPKGDCKGLYVTNETPGSFEVRELGGGQSSIAFNYRIVVKRKGYESDRLARVSPPKDTKLSKSVNASTPETTLVSAKN